MNTEVMPLKSDPHPPCGMEHPPATTKTRGTRAALVLCVLAAIVVGVTSWSGSRKKRCYMCNNVCYPYPCKLPPPHVRSTIAWLFFVVVAFVFCHRRRNRVLWSTDWCFFRVSRSFSCILFLQIISSDDPSDAAAVGVLRDGASITTETGMATTAGSMETTRGSRAPNSAIARDGGGYYAFTHKKAKASYYIPQRKRAKAGTGGAGYYSRYYSHSKSDKKKSSKKDDKKQKKYRKAALRIVETIDPVDPNGSGDITLSLGFNPLTQGLTLVGSNFVTNGAVFKPQDIKVVEGKLIGTIPFEKQLGESSSTCVISKGDFDPDNGIIFIASATCNYSTCFSSGQFNDRVEQCFFGISGGTLNINAAQLIFGEPINGILLGTFSRIGTTVVVYYG